MVALQMNALDSYTLFVGGWERATPLPSSATRAHGGHVGQKRKGTSSLESMLSCSNFPPMSCTLRGINWHSPDFLTAVRSGKRSLGLRKGLVSGEENYS